MRLKHKTASVSSNRLPEKWFRRGLWLVAVVFASFLIGLGGKIVGDLPQVTPYQNLEAYMDASQHAPLQLEQVRLEAEKTRLQAASEQAALAWEQKRNQTESEQTSLNNWLATRSATEQSAQNPEVIARTQKIDGLKLEERQAQLAVEALQTQSLQASQDSDAIHAKIDVLRDEAQVLKDADDRKIELQVFLYRLALTLPLLLVATYLFLKQRQSKWWPFVWGFIFFALFAFFVELVPYLPSYGGYVRYIVGILLTLLIGRYAIVAMNRYLARKQAEEALPSSERQQQLSYDMAHARISKGVCPSCERPTDFNNTHLSFCPHCGIGLFHSCGTCNTRKNAFNQYCHQCGAADVQPEEHSV